MVSYGLEIATSLVSFFSPIKDASDTGFAAFLAEVKSSEGFRDGSERCRLLGLNLGIPAVETHALLQILRDVYRKFRSAERQGQSFGEILDSFLEDGLELVKDTDQTYGTNSAFVERLRQLFERSLELDRADKLNRLERGFSDELRSVEAFVDLRPNFSEDRTKIEEMVPVIQLRFTTNSENPSQEYFVVNVKQKTLDELSAAIEDVQARLKTLANQSSLSDIAIMDRSK